jgi:hypothetical protein
MSLSYIRIVDAATGTIDSDRCPYKEIPMSHNSSSDSWMYEDGYSAGTTAGESAGVMKERKRILDWVKANRSYIEIDAGIGITRDHFDSKDLEAFIERGLDG